MTTEVLLSRAVPEGIYDALVEARFEFCRRHEREPKDCVLGDVKWDQWMEWVREQQSLSHFVVPTCAEGVKPYTFWGMEIFYSSRVAGIVVR